MIKTIKDLDITASGVSVFNRKWQPIHLQQGEIVEVPFELPDGSILPHPALVLSNEYLQDYEDGLFYAVLCA